MLRLLNRWSISTRLYVLIAMVGCGLTVQSVMALQIEWRVLREGRLAGVNGLTEVASSILAYNYALATSGALTEAAAKQAALREVGALRFDHGNYVFVLDANNVAIEHPDPALLGKDRSKTTDATGFNYTADVMPRARRDGAAAVSYMFAHNGQTQEKLSIYRNFAPWDWTVGTGVYIDDLHASFWSAARLFATGGITLLLVLAGFAQLIIRSVVRPLTALRGIMAELAAGKTVHEVPYRMLSGEFGAMAAAISTFREGAMVRLRLERESAEASQEVEAVRRRTEAAVVAAAADQAASAAA